MLKEKHTQQPIKLVIADDHEIFRDGLKLMLAKFDGITICGDACNGRELIQLVNTLHPDIVITDIKMPLMDGVEATNISCSTTRIQASLHFLCSMKLLIVEMLEAGASGYLVKDCDKHEVKEAIEKVYNKGQYYRRHTAINLCRYWKRNAKQENKPACAFLSDKEKISYSLSATSLQQRK